MSTFGSVFAGEVGAAISAAVGALVGLVTAAAAARTRAARQRALRAEAELGESLAALRRAHVAASVRKEYVVRQEEALEQLQATEVRRDLVARLLAGYLLLGALLLVTASLVVDDLPAPPFFAAAAVALGVAIGLFLLGEARKVRLTSWRFVPVELSVDQPSPERKSGHIESLVAAYLSSAGWEVEQCDADSQVDFHVRRGNDVQLVEVKYRPTLALRDLDAALGSAMRTSHSRDDEPVQLVLVAPEAAVDPAAISSYLNSVPVGLMTVMLLTNDDELRPLEASPA